MTSNVEKTLLPHGIWLDQVTLPPITSGASVPMDGKMNRGEEGGLK